MKFAQNRFYIESYQKCSNCGVLLYEGATPVPDPLTDEKTYCSAWCLNWSRERDARRASAEAPA